MNRPSGACATVKVASMHAANSSPSERGMMESRFAHSTCAGMPAAATASTKLVRLLVNPHHAAMAIWLGWNSAWLAKAKAAGAVASRSSPNGWRVASVASPHSSDMARVSENTSSSTRSGCEAAKPSSMPPPKEWPMSVARSMPRASRVAVKALTTRPKLHRPRKENRLGTTTRQGRPAPPSASSCAVRR
jgi:hypothetical protein